MRLSELQHKEIISTIDGKKVGRIIDAEVSNGSIVYFVVESKRLFNKFIISGKETTLTLNQIKKIGEDVILVDL